MSSISSGSDASAPDKDVVAADTEDTVAPQVVVEDVDGEDYFLQRRQGDDEELPSTLEDELEGEMLDGENILQDEASPSMDQD